MFEELKGKRLLVLGGSAWIDMIRTFAKENDIEIISAGNDQNSPLTKLGEFCHIDSIDHEKMKQLIEDKSIDGVYLGSNETVISHALQYTEELGLPHFCSIEQWNLLMNKKKFKELCEEHGLPVAHSYLWDPDHRGHVKYPVLVKPADGCGSTGITICRNERELENGYNYAMSNSHTKQVLVEKKLIALD